jgi:RNA polymerase sigma-70 factor (ECF subfamily)
VQRGDRRAAAGLYDRLLRVLESTLRRVLGGAGPDHDDLLQTVFEDVLVGLYRGQFRGECSLTSWAASIACHRALNVIRSRKTARKYLHQDGEAALDQAPAATDVERTVATRQNIERVRVAMAGLGAGQAETVLMHEVLGYSLAEVAAATGVSVAAAQSRLVRGKKELEARLGAVREGVR